ncbi:MAG TPA: AI-2E family transporter [Candidatus Onthocola stercorigallinarum]|nr:AI-2E family transporter [Candidatus Onthocola stercorigallinarum]
MFRKKNNIDTDGLNEIIYLSKNILKLLFIVLIISIVLVAVMLCREIGIFRFIGNVLSVISPLFIGFIVAWLFNPLVNKMTKKGMSRIIASIIVYIIFILFLVVFFRVFIPIIYNELNELIGTIPSIVSDITNFINDIFNKIDDAQGFDIKAIKDGILDAITAYGNSISSNLPTTIMNIMGSLFSGLGSIFFGLIIGLYMLFDFDNVTVLFLKLIPSRHQMEIAGLLDKIGVEVRKTVNGTLLVACMVFVCDTIGFSIIGLKSALLFGLFCGITDLIPYIGPWLGTAVATVVGLTQSPLVGLGVLIIAVIVQMVESYVLQPVVMSKATNLHPVTIICGLLIFGHFFGIVGMILATPIMSIIKVIWHFIADKFELFERKDKEKVAQSD